MMFTELEDEEASEVVVKRCHLTTSALKKNLQMTDDLVDHFFEVDHFLGRSLKSMHGVASCKEVYEDTQRQSKQRTPLFFTKSSVCFYMIPCTLFDHCELLAKNTSVVSNHEHKCFHYS
jgi:hypothetical protein